MFFEPSFKLQSYNPQYKQSASIKEGATNHLMRLIIFLNILLFFCYDAAKAQFLHTPKEINHIIETSTVTYQTDSILPAQPLVPYPVLSSKYEHLLTANTTLADTIQTTSKRKKYLKKANNSFFNGNYQQAIEFYKKFGVVNHHQEIVVRMAYAYQQLRLPDEAISLYEYLLSDTLRDAFIHFQLACCYRMTRNFRKACQQITLAHLYNRNHPAYLDSLVSLYRHCDWTFRKMDFTPLYELHRNPDSTVYIRAATTPWLAFASCKAVWAFEPGYFEKMKFLSNAQPDIIETKECLFNALAAYEELEPSKKADYPGLSTLSSALPDKRIDDFILYEITSRQQPEILHHLPANRFLELVDYLYDYRILNLEN